MNEFNLLSHAERIAYCRTKLRAAEELEASIREMPWTPELGETLQSVLDSQREFTAALAALEKPSLWRRINQAVNDAAARSRVSDDAKLRRKRVRCLYCRGTGRRLSDSGTYYQACGCGGRDLGYHAGDPEVELATWEAARRRGEIR